MARGSRESTEKGGGQLTVADYTQRFLERTLENVLTDVEGREEKQRLAESNFLNLMHKLQEAGHKDDIRVPLRVLRDEIGKNHFQSGAGNRAEKVEVLFKLYDALEAAAQQDARSKDPKTAAAGMQMMDELRQRFSRLVIGDTWEAWPQLKLLALKRIHTYATIEKESEREITSFTPPPTPTGRIGMRKLSRSISGMSSSLVGSWQATMEDLGKAPGSRLLPLIKLLLIDGEGSAPTEQELRTNGSIKSRDSLRTKDSLEPQGSAKPALTSHPSGFSEVAEATHRISVLEMDDLLGLKDNSHTPVTADPFTKSVSAEGFPAAGQAQPSATQYQYMAAPTANTNYPQNQPQYPATNPQYVQSSRTNGAVYQQPQPVMSYHGQPYGSPGRPAVNQQLSGHSITPKIQLPDRADSGLVSSSNPGSFNPFDLPSPSYSSRTPIDSDNNFADFSPVAAAPHAPSPAPMRAQASGNLSPRVATTNTYLQPPISGFDQRN